MGVITSGSSSQPVIFPSFSPFSRSGYQVSFRVDRHPGLFSRKGDAVCGTEIHLKSFDFTEEEVRYPTMGVS